MLIDKDSLFILLRDKILLQVYELCLLLDSSGSRECDNRKLRQNGTDGKKTNSFFLSFFFLLFKGLDFHPFQSLDEINLVHVRRHTLGRRGRKRLQREEKRSAAGLFRSFYLPTTIVSDSTYKERMRVFFLFSMV